jgi:ABC-type sugar transport system ATPase subunit
VAVEFRNVSRVYKGKPALDGFDLAIEPRSFTVLCGPPASGKSVLFRILVGLEAPDAGRVLLDGVDITETPPAERTVGYVPQSFALYPHLTVAGNMAYPLALAKVAKAEIATRVERTAAILSIGHLLKKTPDQLSGGEKQRVAVARGLLKDAKVFVLDDPLVGLDYKLRERLMDELKALRRELDATFLYATSDSLEALTMAERLVVIDRGRVVQHASAAAVYHDPRHARSLDLVGFPHANLVAGRIEAGTVEAGPLRFAAPSVSLPDGEIVAGLRPEAIRFDAADARDDAIRLDAQVTLVENLGGEAVIYLQAEGQALTATLPISGGLPPDLGSRARIAVDPAEIMLFDAATGARLDGEAS